MCPWHERYAASNMCCIILRNQVCLTGKSTNHILSYVNCSAIFQQFLCAECYLKVQCFIARGECIGRRLSLKQTYILGTCEKWKLAGRTGKKYSTEYFYRSKTFSQAFFTPTKSKHVLITRIVSWKKHSITSMDQESHRHRPWDSNSSRACLFVGWFQDLSREVRKWGGEGTKARLGNVLKPASVLNLLTPRTLGDREGTRAALGLGTQLG